VANSLLTATAVTREALRILHQKAKFLRSINKQYDNSFAQTGAKIGDSLKVRLPNRYKSGTGATATFSDTTETSTTLQVATQRWVAMNFTSAELTLSLDDFSKRIIAPAISQLAADIENDALSMYKDVANIIDNDAAALTFKNILQAGQRLDECLAPQDDQRTVLLTPSHNVTLVDALKGLFNDSKALSGQYRDGYMGHSAGFDFDTTTFLGNHTTGTAIKATGYLSNGATQTGASIAVDTGVTTFKKGDVITFAGVNAIHPESKADLGYLKNFVLTADYAGGAGNIAISPAIVSSNTDPAQNVTSSIADNSAIVKVGAAASELLTNSLAFHKDAFTFATADLIMPKGTDFGAREVLDGISMRIVRDYDIVNDKMLCRVDVLYGFKALRPELAARIHADG
jgi:hypothetical protein